MWISILQIIIAIAIIVLILLQERSSGISGLFGGGGGDTGLYQARRGLEKWTLVATVVLTIFFATLAILQILL